MWSKIFKKIFRHKLIAGIILIIIIATGYFSYKKISQNENSAQYATAAVEKGAIIVSVSGSGQTAVSDQTDIKPKVSGDIAYVGVKNGQEVKTGALIAQIDSSSAQKAAADSKTALETAQLELEELLSPPDELTLTQAENSVLSAKRSLEKLLAPPAEADLRQAENALIQTRDSLTKLKFTQETNYQNAIDAKQKAEDNIAKGYEEAFNAISNVFLDLPTIITGLRDILYSEEIAKSEPTLYNYYSNISALINSISAAGDDKVKLEKFANSAEGDYKTAREKYDQNFDNYKAVSRYSTTDVIEALLTESIETVKLTTQAVKSETNMFDYWVSYRSDHNLATFSQVTAYQSNLASYTSKTNSHLSNFLSIERNIKDNKESKLNAERDIIEMNQNNPLDLAASERTVKEKEDSLAKLKDGAEAADIVAARETLKERELSLAKLKSAPLELDIRAKKIAIQQKQDDLLQAQKNLADYNIRAPFDGIITNVNAKKGDSVSSGTALAALITKQKIAEIILNEIDVAKVALEQKANITFDAVSDLNITGQVAEVDALGTTSQGVVSYGVRIAFDTQNEQIKPGMSLSASIITEAKTDVLLAPNAAVKQSAGQGGIFYVEVLSNSQTKPNLAEAKVLDANVKSSPRRQTVTVGLSNDTMIEIIDGLKEGDQVVTQTITSNSSQNQSQQNRGFGGNNQMPGMIRMIR